MSFYSDLKKGNTSTKSTSFYSQLTSKTADPKPSSGTTVQSSVPSQSVSEVKQIAPKVETQSSKATSDFIANIDVGKRLHSAKKVEPSKINTPPNAITKVAEQRDNLKKMGMASTRKVMSEPKTLGQKVVSGAKAVGRDLQDFKRSFYNTLTFGATDKIDKQMGLANQEEINRAKDSIAGKTGTIAGYIGPGGAADAAASLLVNPIVKNAPKLVQGMARLGTGGALFQTGLEAGEALSGQNHQSLGERAKDIGISTAIGAGLPVVGALAKGTFKSIGKALGGSKASAVDSVVNSVPEAAQAVRGAVNDVPLNSSPNPVRPVMNSSNNASPLHKIGDEAIPTSVDGTELSGAAKIVDIQSKDGVNYYRFDGSNTYMPENQVKVSRSAFETAAAQEPQQGIRRNFANQLNNGNFSPELQQGIRNTDQTYGIKTNQASVNAADEVLKDMSHATSKFLNNEAGGAEHIALGYKLQQRLDSLGKHEEALAVSRKLAADLTNSGQTQQAASIISRLSPEGQLLNLVRQAEKNGKEVTVADSVKFKELAAKVQENAGAGIKANQFNEILNRMEKGENVGVADIKKLSDYLSGAEKVVKPSKLVDDLPTEFKDVKKRDKIISFLDDAEQAALARIAARKSRLNALPLDEWADHAIVVSAQIAKGSIKAATHAEDLVKLFGEEIRPIASQVFQKAQGLVKTVSRRAGEGDLQRAHQVLRNATGQSAADKAIVEETAKHVRKMIADAKAGNIDPADAQKLRDYSDEIADMTKDAKPGRIPTQEEKFLQSVKSLAKKIAKVESEKIPPDQANREVSSLLRQVLKIADEGTPQLARQPIDNTALSNIAHDVMNKTRPNPKPTTLQEKIVEKYLKENPTVSQKDIDSLRDLAKNITRLSGDAKIDADIAMQKILNSYEKSSVWDKLQSIRYMGMLLNTHTQMINAGSGPIMATTGAVADVFGTMLDISMNKLFKTPRNTTLYGTNPLRFMAGYMKNLKTGAKAGAVGANPAGIQNTGEIRGLAHKSLYNPFGLAERALGAVSKGPDYATYKTVYDSEIAKKGFLSAKNKGIKGKANIDNHIREFVNDPPEEAILDADRIGKNTTFQRSDSLGGQAANWLNSGEGKVKKFIRPLTSAIVPFVRTPLNIASTAVTMTPAGVVKGLFQLLSSKSSASQREAIRTMSLGVTGTGIGAVGYYLSQLGIITGANDSGNKDVDNIREQAGKGKYRFNTSGLQRYVSAMLNGEGWEAAEKAAKYREFDKQFDYNKLQPLAFPLAIGAGLEGSKEKGLSGALGGAGTDAYGSLFGMTTLKGMQSVFQPSYGGSQGEKNLGFGYRVAESFFKSFSPGGLAQEARRQDPIQRKTPFNDGPITNTKEYFKSRIPGLSKELPARKTTLGQDYKNAPGIKGSYLNPFRSEVAPYNKAAEIISGLIDRTGDMKLAPSAPEKTIRGKNSAGVSVSMDIPAKRYAKLQEDVGNAIIKLVQRIPDKLTDNQKSLLLEEIYKQVREAAMNEVKTEFGIQVK